MLDYFKVMNMSDLYNFIFDLKIKNKQVLKRQ